MIEKMDKVLLVEDDETANFLSKIVLEKAGLKDINVVWNGKEACEYLQKRCPDIIFLDIKMPVMDGWEFLDEKYNRGLCRKVKVAMLSSSIRLEDKEKAKDYDCVVTYLEKPLTVEKVERVKEIIKK